MSTLLVALLFFPAVFVGQAVGIGLATLFIHAYEWNERRHPITPECVEALRSVYVTDLGRSLYS